MLNMAIISGLILCLLVQVLQVASAPGDEHNLCRALSSPPSEGGHVVLLNSYNYISLITGFFPPPVWTQTNLDGNGFGWTEDNGEGLCRHHVRVCDYFTGSLQNNWLFTQYIRFIEAKEVFVNISYNFAECQLHSSCTQTPVELYVQYTSVQVVLPQQRTDPSRYHLVGELQQSRHSQGEQHAMFSISRGSQTNQGFYLGLRDTGSCGVVRQITVYYRVCESRFNGPGLEFYPTLPLPPQNASEPIVASAYCAPDTVSFTAPGYLAYPNGTCVYGATCKCKPGFEKIVLGQQTSTTSRCQACAEGTYRSESDTSCQQCPVNTITSGRAVAECPCDNGYYRTTEEGPSSSCTSPPSDCRNILVMDSMTTSTSLTVQWTRPLTIGRDDFYYNVYYKLSSGADGGGGEYIQHSAIPIKDDSTKVVYTLSDLISFTSYQVRVTVDNGVSDQHTEGSMCDTTATLTNIGPPLSVKEYCKLIVWKPPSNSRGQVTGYEIEFSNPGEQSVSTVTVENDNYLVLQENDTFREFRIHAFVPGASGEWSERIKLCDSCLEHRPQNANSEQYTIKAPDYVDGVTCINSGNRFTCTCPSGFTGDGKVGGTGCTDSDITVNDTVIWNPIFTTPILVPESDLQALNISSLSLCYEIHGGNDTYFNLVTDECASVNAHYFSATSSLNFIDEIGVRAVDNDGNCKNILVSLADNCSVNVDGNALTSGRYSANGIMIRKYPNRVRISVPNCNELTLVMWVFCETRVVDDSYSETGQYFGEMLEFMVMRGLNFGHRHAHGLLGQFWNVPVRVSKFTGVDRNGVAVPPESRQYVLNYTLAVSGEPRTYTGWLYELTWSFEERPCIYVGNSQGGPIYEVTDPNDEVVEGGYRSYRVPSAFSEEEYDFSLFNEERCKLT